jgi:polyhydroxyalkanoate synthase
MTRPTTDRTPTPFDLYVNAHRDAVRSATATARRAVVAAERLADARSVEIGETPNEVVYTENKLELRRYEPLTETQHEVPILIVYALINRPAILDLQPDRSVVRRLLEAGHDVYLIDWNEPSRLDRHLTLEDYVMRYVDNCVDVVRERSGQDTINLLGYCMGGTMAAIYTALFPEKVNALGLLAAALHFDDTGGVLERWGDAEHYDPRAVVEAYGNVPAEMLDLGFALMDPVSNVLSKYVRFADRLENEDFAENFARVERWLSEGVDLAGATYVQFVEEIYQRDALYRNELSLGGEHVDVTRIGVPVLQVVGSYDHLVPPAASEPFNDVVGTGNTTTIEYPTGHVGLAMSTSTHRDVWPEVAEWFLEQSPTRTLADVLGEGVERALGVDVETDVTVGDADEMEVAVADRSGPIARSVVERELEAIEGLLEGALSVGIELDVGEEGIAVTVESGGDRRTTVVTNVGEAVRTEVEEAIARTDVAAREDLEDVEGIGPTYGDRLRTAGVDSVADLAEAEPGWVAEAAGANTTLARRWIERARRLVDSAAKEPCARDGTPNPSRTEK